MSSETLSATEHKMARAVEVLERDLQGVRTGRASTSLVERVMVEYYGTPTALNQLAGINVPEAHQIVIQPWDRGVLGAIEKAIIKSDIGLVPNVDGAVVRLNIPPLTEERRKDLVKQVHKRMEEARVEIRNLRREAADGLKKEEHEGTIGTDEVSPRARAAAADHGQAHCRRGPRRRGQGTGDPGGLVARRISRPTDSPARVHRESKATVDRGAGPPSSPDATPTEAFPVPEEELPRHVAIIMDGNRRWAKARGLTEMEGHAAGVEAIREIIRHAVRRGIGVLSLYAFSRENWARSDEEVRGLFSLLEKVIRNETAELNRQGARVRLLGRIEELPPATRASIQQALDATAGGTRLQLNIAFNYSGRTELVDAARELVARGVRPEEIDEDVLAGALYTAGLPDPDIVIRTGGDERLSNFLIWQAAYAEFYFSPILWPDFGPDAFDAALVEYASRQRRFGR